MANTLDQHTLLLIMDAIYKGSPAYAAYLKDIGRFDDAIAQSTERALKGTTAQATGFNTLIAQSKAARDSIVLLAGGLSTLGGSATQLKPLSDGLLSIVAEYEKLDKSFKNRNAVAAWASAAGASIQRMLHDLNALIAKEARTAALFAARKEAITSTPKKEQTVEQRAALPGIDAALKKSTDYVKVLRDEKMVLEALSRQLPILGTNLAGVTSRVEEQVASQTQFQKAGQGMILSMSLMQLQAGNLQNALFGLGFSLLFVAEGLKGSTGGWAILFAAIQIAGPMLVKLADGADEVGDALKKSEENVQRWGRALERATDPALKMRDEMMRVVEAIEKGDASVEGFVDQASRVDRGLFAKISESLTETLNPLDKNFLNAAGTFEENMNNQIDSLRTMVEASRNAYQKLSQEITDKRSEYATEDAKRGMDKAKDIFRDQLKGLEKAGRARISADQEAADKVSEDRADELTDAIEAAAKARTRAIERELDAQLDAIKDQSDDVVDAVKNRYDAELEANKRRIDALKDAEKELVTELNDITKRRMELFGELVTIQEEMAAIERLQRQFGEDKNLTAEMAMRRARETALHKEDAALVDRTGEIGTERAGIQQQVTSLEAAQDEIKAREDAEVESIQRRRDAEIQAAQDAAEARKDLVNEQLEREREAVSAWLEEERTKHQTIADQRNAALDVTIAKQEGILTGVDNIVAAVERHRDRESEINILLGQRQAALVIMLETMDKIAASLQLIDTFGGDQAFSEWIAENAIKGPLWHLFENRDAVGDAAEGAWDKATGLFRHAGGPVPGLPGETTLIRAQAGEHILSLADTAAYTRSMSPASASNVGGGSITVNIERVDASNPMDVERMVSRISQAQGRSTRTGMRSGKYTKGF